jgi:hypothetical protein
MRKVYVTVTVRLTINQDDGVSIKDVIDEMEYGFTSQTEGADVIDEEISDFEVINSK